MARQFHTAAACFVAICVLQACSEPPHTVDDHASVGETDAREAIVLSHGERDLVLAEMRMMLESTEGVVAGLAANDMQAVEQAAARAAPSAPGTVDQELHASLPEAFLHSGAAAHGGFEDIARLARQAAGTEALMRRLGETLHQCTSCHAAYRVEVAR
jgi:cytochrome c556